MNKLVKALFNIEWGLHLCYWHHHRWGGVGFADEREYSSPGLELARRHGVQAAPFFIVEQEEITRVYTKYSRFLKEILGYQTSEREEINEIMAQHPDLDFI